MPASDDDLLRRLRATFRAEAQEHLRNMASGLVALERPGQPLSREVLDEVFRAAHSLKGAARAVNAGGIESLCQALETALAALRRETLAPSAELFDLLHRGNEVLARALAALEAAPEQAVPGAAELRRGLNKLVSRSRASPPPSAPSAAWPGTAAGTTPGTPAGTTPGTTPGAATGATPSAATIPVTRSATTSAGPPVPSSIALSTGPSATAPQDTVRVRRDTLDAVLLQSEELLFAKLAAVQRAEAMRTLGRHPGEWRKRAAALRADLRSVARALQATPAPPLPAWRRIEDFVEASHDAAGSIEAGLLREARAAEHDQRAVAAMVDELLEQMKSAALQPFARVLELFPPAVRQMSRDRRKEVELRLQGAEVEVDRRILEAIKDPLIHLVRNAIDHGIEVPALRRERGKPERGSLWVEVNPVNGDAVEVTVRDDGAGIDTVALRQAAQRAGVRALPEAELTPQALLALACEAGVSTSPMVTDLSGRGLGLSVVRHEVERIGGSLAVESEPGRGTLFRLRLPLTLSRFRGVVVRLGRQRFVLPTRSVERVARVRREDVRSVENRETVAIEGRALALVRLDRVLGMAAEDDGGAAFFPVAVIGHNGQAVAFRIDEVVDEREVLVKPLARPLQRVRHLAGASVVGGGSLVPVLHVPDLLKSAADAAGNARAPDRAATTDVGKSILVAEDSITSRTLLKGILEGAGYRVEAVADGVEAFAALRAGRFDLVVTDVDMPRLNGFGLTAKIRGDRVLSELPVVLVTALDSREDREHGIDVGASAYIVKSSFDQGNLLEVVRRLA